MVEPAASSFPSSWHFLSLACAAGAVALTALLYSLPPSWAAPVGGASSLFVGVYLFVASLDPDRFYRRWIGWTIFMGLAAYAGASTLEAFVLSDPARAAFRWDGSVSLTFNTAWPAVVAILAWLEWQRTRRAEVHPVP